MLHYVYNVFYTVDEILKYLLKKKKGNPQKF